MSIGDKILRAQQSIAAVAKDASNQFHKYDYVSSEGMITACRDALHAAGLSVVCVSRKIVRNGTDAAATLESTFRVFDGAEHVDGSIDMPIVPDKGRPMDKAACGSMTTSLSYFLRDLLLVPRKDEADITRRDDRDYDPEKVRRGSLVSRLKGDISEFAKVRADDAAFPATGKAVMQWLGYKRSVSELSVNDLDNAINTLSERIAEGATFTDVPAVAAK